MPGSPNGPAYGSQPKLVVMKVLCKLRWRKIRHPLIFSHSLYLHSFSVFLSVFLSPCSFSPLLSIFLTRCVFLSVSLRHVLSLSSPLFILYLFHFLSFKLSLVFTVIFHALLPLCLSHPFSCPSLTLPFYQNRFVPHLLSLPLFLSFTLHLHQFFSGTLNSIQYVIYFCSNPHFLPPSVLAVPVAGVCVLQMGQEVLSVSLLCCQDKFI